MDQDQLNEDEFWNDQLNALTDSYFPWALSAEQLLDGFEILVARSPQLGLSLSPAAHLLAGFAIECLMKSVLVRRGDGRNEKGEFVLRSHDLMKYAEMIPLPLSNLHAEVLERVTAYILWAGRYPVPLKADDLKPRARSGNRIGPVPGHWEGQDWEPIRDIVRTLKGMLPPFPERESM